MARRRSRVRSDSDPVPERRGTIALPPVDPARGACPRVKIQEADAKSLLVAQGLPVPAWAVAHTVAEARAAAERFLAEGAGKVVIKAQVLVGGRGKAGGVKLAGSARRGASRSPARSSGMDIKGITVRKVLVGPAADIVKEFYLAAVLDRAERRILLMGSAEGGVEIEQVAEERPEAIVRLHAHPTLGLQAPRRAADGVRAGSRRPPQGRGRDRPGPRPDDDRLRRRPRRDQPARDRPRDRRPTARRRAARLPRREDHARRLRAPPPPGPRGPARPRRGGARGPRGARGRPDVHQARRHDRLHGQRRRAGDDDDGPGQAGRRRARELPRHRRRRAGRQGRRRDAPDPRRPEGQRDPREHLRRHHPRRRGRPRADRGPRAAGPRRADGRPDRRHERRARRVGCSPRRGSRPRRRSTRRRPWRSRPVARLPRGAAA